MPAIEFGIDGTGRRVSADDAIKGRSYKCYYCKEDIIVRKGDKRIAYFAHAPISNRTPQQMACEGYKGHGAGESYIDNDEDRICIFNGGVPLHLIETMTGRFELVAMFPPLSEKSMRTVIDLNAKVRVTHDGREQVYSAWNFRRYRVQTSSKWIYVKPENFKPFNEEIKRKWFWGFRGLDFDNDLFRADSNGGVRVGQLANICVGREYLFINLWTKEPKGRGLRFKKKGVFSFPNLLHRREYDVYSVTVTEVTDDSIAFIQKKGYQLIEKSDDLIPMWPPAVTEGKELVFHDNDREAYLYHKTESSQQVFVWGEYSPQRIVEEDNVFKCSTNNMTLLLSDYSFDALAKEVRFVLTHNRDHFIRDRHFEYIANILTDSGKVLNISPDVLNESFMSPLLMESNYKTVALSFRNNYVIRSTSKRIDELSKDCSLYFGYEPFGSICIVRSEEVEEDKPEKTNTVIKADYAELIFILLHCGGATTVIPPRFDEWITYAENHSAELAKILMRWKYQNRVPIKALLILRDMEEHL